MYAINKCKFFADKSGGVYLPCKVGASVYVNCATWGVGIENCKSIYIAGECFCRAEVVSVIKTKKQKLMKLKAVTKTGKRLFKKYCFGSIGRTVFLTKEEIEKAEERERE